MGRVSKKALGLKFLRSYQAVELTLNVASLGVVSSQREKDLNNFWGLCDIIKHIHKESQSTLIKHDQAPHRSLINYYKRLRDILPQKTKCPKTKCPKDILPQDICPTVRW